MCYLSVHIKILDREGLEVTSCECCGIVRREYEQMVESKEARDRAPHK